MGGRPKVLVVDFGGQYTHLIARRCRELGVYSEIVEPGSLEEALGSGSVRGLILSGGPRSVLEQGSPRVSERILRSPPVPILGICYGHQLIAHMLGGRVVSGLAREYGRVKVRVVERDKLFKDIPSELEVWMSHGDSVAEPPKNMKATSLSENRVITSMSDGEKIYATQFHPEVSHTQHGKTILRNFLQEICRIPPTWKPSNMINEMVENVRRTVGGERVICAVSGGVDSMTTAYILSKAVGGNLYCIFVDTGLLRKGEGERVEEAARRAGIKNLIKVDARERFLTRLRGVKDPEEKRRIIGEEFIKIFEETVAQIPGARWLAQGTIYPDRVESGRAGKGSALIKSHHNVGALPERLGLKLIEPLRDLYKDEVREIAEELGVPEEIIWRHPFPGPGLAVRIIGEVTEEKLRICREASAIVEEEITKSGLQREIWQAFAVVGDDKWVGVTGDARTLGYIVTVRLVESVDGMTADWPRISHHILERISRRITNEVPGVVMVTYAITPKPPATIEPC